MEASFMSRRSIISLRKTLNGQIVRTRNAWLVRYALLYRFIRICVAHRFRLLLCISAIWPCAIKKNGNPDTKVGICT